MTSPHFADWLVAHPGDLAIGFSPVIAGRGVGIRVLAVDGAEWEGWQEQARAAVAALTATGSLPARRLFVSDPRELSVSRRDVLDWLGFDVWRCASFEVASRVLSAHPLGASLSAFSRLMSEASDADLCFVDELDFEDRIWRSMSVRVDFDEMAKCTRLHQRQVDSFSRTSGVDMLGRSPVADSMRWLRAHGASAVVDSPERGHDVVRVLDASGLNAELFAEYKATVSSASRIWAMRKVKKFVRPEDGTVSPTVEVNGTMSGRHRMVDPALQALPKNLRSIVAAPSDDVQLWSADHSGAELSTLAALTSDPSMVAEGRDIYADIAAVAGTDRAKAKDVVLAWMYGQGRTSAAEVLGGDVELAGRVHEAIASLLPGVVDARQRLEAEVTAGRHLYTLAGRRLPLVDPAKKYLALNRVMQGSAKDAFGAATRRLVELAAAEGVAVKPYLAMHDELIVAAPVGYDAEPLLLEAMGVVLPGAAGVRMRSKVELLGSNWGPRLP